MSFQTPYSLKSEQFLQCHHILKKIKKIIKCKIQGKDSYITKIDFNQKENCIFKTRTFFRNVKSDILLHFHLGTLTNVVIYIKYKTILIIFLGQNNGLCFCCLLHFMFNEFFIIVLLFKLS